jgi:hypothetical protein
MHPLLISLAIVSDFLVEPADLNYMKTTITDYLSKTRHHDFQYRIYKHKTQEYIHNEFVRFGLATEYDTFSEPSVSLTVRRN